MSTDKIEKKILLHAPRKRVWRALSDSAEFGHWFGMKFDGPFAPGATMHRTIVPTKVNAEVARDRKQFGIMRTYVAQVAATAYEDGNMTSMAALITSANPQTVLSRASMLVQLSSASSDSSASDPMTTIRDGSRSLRQIGSGVPQ